MSNKSDLYSSKGFTNAESLLAFDEVDDEINLGNVSFIDESRDFSIELIVSKDSSTANKGIIDKGDTTGLSLLYLSSGGGAIRWFVGATGLTVVQAGELTYGQLYHIVLTYESSTGRFRSYLNGVQKDNKILSGFVNSDDLIIGNRTSFSQYADIKFGLLRFYSHTISQQEINQLQRFPYAIPSDLHEYVVGEYIPQRSYFKDTSDIYGKGTNAILWFDSSEQYNYANDQYTLGAFSGSGFTFPSDHNIQYNGDQGGARSATSDVTGLVTADPGSLVRLRFNVVSNDGSFWVFVGGATDAADKVEITQTSGQVDLLITQYGSNKIFFANTDNGGNNDLTAIWEVDQVEVYDPNYVIEPNHGVMTGWSDDELTTSIKDFYRKEYPNRESLILSRPTSSGSNSRFNAIEISNFDTKYDAVSDFTLVVKGYYKTGYGADISLYSPIHAGNSKGVDIQGNTIKVRDNGIVTPYGSLSTRGGRSFDPNTDEFYPFHYAIRRNTGINQLIIDMFQDGVFIDQIIHPIDDFFPTTEPTLALAGSGQISLSMGYAVESAVWYESLLSDGEIRNEFISEDFNSKPKLFHVFPCEASKLEEVGNGVVIEDYSTNNYIDISYGSRPFGDWSNDEVEIIERTGLPPIEKAFKCETERLNALVSSFGDVIGTKDRSIVIDLAVRNVSGSPIVFGTSNLSVVFTTTGGQDDLRINTSGASNPGNIFFVYDQTLSSEVTPIITHFAARAGLGGGVYRQMSGQNLDQEGTATEASDLTGQNLFIGTLTPSQGAYYIARAAIYSRILDEKEVKQMYNNGFPKNPDSLDQCECYFLFNEGDAFIDGTDLKLRDYSGNDRHALIRSLSGADVNGELATYKAQLVDINTLR